MKKIVLILTMVLTCTFCFTACDGLGKQYWSDMSVNAEDVFTGENFDAIYNIDYSTNLDYIISQPYGQSYAELKYVLSPLFESAIYYAYNHYKDFTIEPRNQSGEFKNKIKDVNNALEKFESELKIFNEKKVEYERFITFVSMEEATSGLELSRLLLFKRDFITAIESAYNLSEKVFEARRVGYYDFSDYSSDEALVDESADCSLAVNISNLSITKCAIQITRAYNAKEMAAEYQNYWTQSQDFYSYIVKPYENGSKTNVADVKSQLYTWQGVYNLFKEECELFQEVLSNIDVHLLSKCGNDTQVYAERTGNEQDKAFAEYYLNFYKNVATLKDYTNKLFV